MTTRDRTESSSPPHTATAWAAGRWRSRLDPLALLVVGGAFWYAAGPPGLGAALVLGVAWVGLPNVAVFVAGLIALAALVPAEAPLAARAVPATALASLLATPTATDRPARDGLAVVAALAALVAVGGVTYGLTELTWAAAAAVAAAGVVGFVSLDLIALSEFGVTDE